MSLVLKHDGLKLLVMIRLCPLPYSISNGAISTFPTVQPLMFAAATAAATPKLLIAIFIGSRLAVIAKSGEKMDTGTKIINWAGIIFGVLLGAFTGWFIYTKYALPSQMKQSPCLSCLGLWLVHGKLKLRKEPTASNQAHKAEISRTTLRSRQLRLLGFEMIKSIS